MLEKLFEKTDFNDVFLIIIASVAIVSVWRGIWGLEDIFLFPDNPVMSCINSLFIGLVVLIGIAFYRSKTNKN